MNEGQLIRIAQDNMRDHQLGGQKDGVSQEVAEDMGFMTDPNDVKALARVEIPRPAGVPKFENPWPTAQMREIGKIGVAKGLETLKSSKVS